MKISVVCVGKIKEKFYRDALEEYSKRLSRYCKFEEGIKRREGERILARLKEDAYVITLEILGERLDSPAFAGLLEQIALRGKSHIQFVIGGSLGLHESVSARADKKLSFSDMTFPHQLMRVILSEQIYRGYRIINGEPYHK